MHTWYVFTPSAAPLEMGALRQAAYDLGLAADFETASDDGSAYAIGPEGEEPRIELSFRLVDRIDLRDRIAEAQSRPPAELAPAVEQAQLEYLVLRPVGFSLDEDELCRGLVSLIAARAQGVVWEPDEKRWWSAEAFAKKYTPRAV